MGCWTWSHRYWFLHRYYVQVFSATKAWAFKWTLLCLRISQIIWLLLFIVLNPSYPHIDECHFVKQDWREFYCSAKDQIPSNAPEPRGKSEFISCFIDANHGVDRVMCQSHTSIIIFCNQAPIIWYNKQQNTVGTFTFDLEFVAARIAVEFIESLHNKLWMFGVPINGPANVYCWYIVKMILFVRILQGPNGHSRRNITLSLTIGYVRLLLPDPFMLLGSQWPPILLTC